MRVAFITDRFPVLSETFVIRQVAGMVKQGHEVTVISLQPGEQGVRHEVYEKQELARHVLTVQRSSSPLRLCYLLLRLLSLCIFSGSARRRLQVVVRTLRSGNRAAVADLLAVEPASGAFDVMIAHFGPQGVRALALRDAGLLSGALATVFHGMDMSSREILQRYMPLYRDLLARSEMFLPISELWADRLRAWGADPARLHVLRMGVDVEALPVVVDHAPGQPLKVLCVGRFTEKKGQLDAIRAVRACHLGVCLDLIGGGELESELRTAAGGDARIRFLGKRSQQEVLAALAAADVFLLPSVTAASGDMEGIPVALMEAMAMGVVVVSTRHSGIPELVQDGVSGFLVDEHDVTALTARLEELAAGAHDLTQMRQAARQKVVDEFNNARLDTELEQLCRQLARKVAR